MKIKNGGKTESLNRRKYIEELSASHEENNGRSITLMINQDSISYLNMDEALDLRNELNKAIKKVTGI